MSNRAMSNSSSPPPAAAAASPAAASAPWRRSSPSCPGRPARLAALLAGLIALGGLEHGLPFAVAEAEAAPQLAGSPAAGPGSGAVAQRRRTKKKRKPAATEAPAPTEGGTDEPAADGSDAAGADSGGGAGAGAGSGSAAGSAGGGASGSASGAGAAGAAPSPPATPAEPVATAPEIASSAELVDVDALRQEYLQLRDELFKSRARASTLSSQLYSTKITIRFAFTTGRHYGVNRATIRLDGAAIFDDSEGVIANDDAIRFEGYVAPGKHLLTFRLETTGKDDDRFTSAQEAQIAVQAVAGKDLVVTAKAKDGGDIAYSWKKSEKGSYGLGIDVAVKTQKREAAK
jgi:hypothetical protein